MISTWSFSYIGIPQLETPLDIELACNSSSDYLSPFFSRAARPSGQYFIDDSCLAILEALQRKDENIRCQIRQQKNPTEQQVN
jgi:hypothetical protein